MNVVSTVILLAVQIIRHGPIELNMDKATQIWNRACDDWQLRNPAVGDHALAAMLLAHGHVMNGGVLHAVELMDEAQLAAAKAGYRFFGVELVSDLFSRTKDALDRGTAAPVELERRAVGDIEVVVLEEDDHLGDLEPQLDSEYRATSPMIRLCSSASSGTSQPTQATSQACSGCQQSTVAERVAA